MGTGATYALLAFGLGLLAALWFIWRETGRTVFEHQKGLLYCKGKFVRELGVGHHRSWSPHSTVKIFDMRTQQLAISGQDVLTADKVNVRV